jgi:hypothetical protein
MTWKPSPVDHSQPDGKPRCFHKACAELAFWAGRRVDQSGEQGKTADEKAQLKAYGTWVTVYVCDRHMIEAWVLWGHDRNWVSRLTHDVTVMPSGEALHRSTCWCQVRKGEHARHRQR